MAMIEFVRNSTGHSTDRGYQFQCRCDQCSNGYMSSCEASIIGTAGGLLQASGNLFRGLLSSAVRMECRTCRPTRADPGHDRLCFLRHDPDRQQLLPRLRSIHGPGSKDLCFPRSHLHAIRSLCEHCRGKLT